MFPISRSDLAESFDLKTLSEALAARRMKLAAAITAITKALADQSISQRQKLFACLEGGLFGELLVKLDAHSLSFGFVVEAEPFREVERRVLFVWARGATMSAMFPLNCAKWSEAGVDRCGAYVQGLIAVGMPCELTREYVVGVHGAATITMDEGATTVA
jgi:hypothetical protein